MSGGPARVPPVRRAMPVAVLAILGLAAPVAAQRDYTTALVPPTHWSADAIRRLDGMGLVHGGYDISQRAPTQDAVATILAAAALADTAHRSLADVWLRRFVEEFGRAPASAVR